MQKPKLKLLFRPGLYLVWGLLCSLKLWSQSVDCPSEPKFDVPGNILRIQGIWKDASSSYVENLNIRSVSGGQYTIKIGKLVQAQSRRVVTGDKISVSESELRIPANGQQSIEVQASNLSEAGLYEGVLEISGSGTGTCKWRLPLRLELHREEALKVLEADQSQTYKYVHKSWLDFVMPAALLQRRIQVRIDNEEALPLRLDSFALAMKGQGSGEQINQGALLLRENQKWVAPRDLKTFQFELVRMPRAADQYNGQLRLYFKEQSEPVLVNLVVYLRRGAGLAFLMLLLGVLLGRLIRYLNKVEEQMPLVKLYYQVAARAGKLKDVVARNDIEVKLNALETKVESAQNAEAIATVQNDLDQLIQQIEQLLQLEVSIELIRENPDLKISASAEKELELHERYLNIRDAVLEAKEEDYKKGLADLNTWVNEMEGERGGGMFTEIDNKLKERLHKSTEAIEKKRLSTIDTAPTFSPMKRRLITVVGFLSGISMNVHSAYLWGRPLVALVTFLVLLLIGYHEMYIKSGDTFGAEGLYDYLKLMLWGALSDGFSQSLVGSKEVLGFLGKEKG